MYRRLSNFIRGRTLKQSEEMTVEQVTETLEEAEPVGAVLSTSSGFERIEPSEAIERLKQSFGSDKMTIYQHYEGSVDSLHYIDAENSEKESGNYGFSLKLREIKF